MIYGFYETQSPRRRRVIVDGELSRALVSRMSAVVDAIRQARAEGTDPRADDRVKAAQMGLEVQS